MKKKIYQSPFEQLTQLFPGLISLISRVFLVLLIIGIVPWLPTPPGGLPVEANWSAFNAWDSVFYESIATQGYQYIDSEIIQGYNVAFFPAFPLFCWLLMQLGLPFNVAGTLINNTAFIGAAILLFGWLKQRYNINKASWIILVLIWCPFSIFGTFIYTEGLFLLVSIAALRAFESQRYRQAAFWGAIATATRPNGVALTLTFLLVAREQKRGIQAYLSGLFSGVGIGLYSLYCGLKFGDFLAFVHTQQAWDRQTGIDWQGWKVLFFQMLFGSEKMLKGLSQYPWHFIALALIFTIALALFYRRDRLQPNFLYYGACVLFILTWLIAGDPFIDFLTIFGGIYLLWQFRQELGSLLVSYGVLSYLIIFNSGSTISAERFVYGTISVAIALGLLLSRYPRYGYATLGFFILLLTLYTIRFAQTLWIA
ncbi:MAG: mannosyltransferase family protein [Jaaginema sp. PMC 1079.18]|nr:mannosyltransferase family protein [Jaaginema sp. PMC 1080.18]MEC4849983.1 mannosyltransferase family protein [Jaaginema sp. PMC 1079.18]MEC4865187.1 mannosyltransferase family protein [Jaaginema sp. PMC 1078.18]